MNFKHQSVLLDETIENLNIQPEGIYVDGTLGGGGHAFHVCSRLNEKGRFIGIDQDAAAIEAAGKRLSPFEDKVTIVRSNYSDMKQVLTDLGISRVNGIVLDLGVSSYQLDTVERGLSMVTAKWSFMELSVITEKINLQRILQNILYGREKKSPLKQRMS